MIGALLQSVDLEMGKSIMCHLDLQSHHLVRRCLELMTEIFSITRKTMTSEDRKKLSNRSVNPRFPLLAIFAEVSECFQDIYDMIGQYYNRTETSL